MSWGIANVLCGLCFVRIGVALTGAILTGLGASVAVAVPLVFKGSGLFKDARHHVARRADGSGGSGRHVDRRDSGIPCRFWP